MGTSRIATAGITVVLLVVSVGLGAVAVAVQLVLWPLVGLASGAFAVVHALADRWVPGRSARRSGPFAPARLPADRPA